MKLISQKATVMNLKCNINIAPKQSYQDEVLPKTNSLLFKEYSWYYMSVTAERDFLPSLIKQGIMHIAHITYIKPKGLNAIPGKSL